MDDPAPTAASAPPSDLTDIDASDASVPASPPAVAPLLSWSLRLGTLVAFCVILMAGGHGCAPMGLAIPLAFVAPRLLPIPIAAVTFMLSARGPATPWRTALATLSLSTLLLAWLASAGWAGRLDGATITLVTGVPFALCAGVTLFTLFRAPLRSPTHAAPSAAQRASLRVTIASLLAALAAVALIAGLGLYMVAAHEETSSHLLGVPSRFAPLYRVRPFTLPVAILEAALALFTVARLAIAARRSPARRPHAFERPLAVVALLLMCAGIACSVAVRTSATRRLAREAELARLPYILVPVR